MAMPRVRFTVRALMAYVALAAVVLAVGIDLGRRWGLVEFETIRYVDDGPLAHPVRVVGIDGRLFVLEDGRVVRFNEDPDLGWVLREGDSGLSVDVEFVDDGSVKVYAKETSWFCGNQSRRAPIRIPIATRTILLNKKILVGTGRIVGRAGDFEGRPGTDAHRHDSTGSDEGRDSGRLESRLQPESSDATGRRDAGGGS
jgi:hypothetical protein